MDGGERTIEEAGIVANPNLLQILKMRQKASGK
jgi:hypothetical protein